MRDAGVVDELFRMGYAVLIVWTCELRRPEMLTEKLALFMRGENGPEV